MSSLNDYDWKKDLDHYRKCLSYLEGDAPIQVLCMPKVIENKLMKNGFTRVYDLRFERLKEIKGLGEKRIDLIMSLARHFVSS